MIRQASIQKGRYKDEAQNKIGMTQAGHEGLALKFDKSIIKGMICPGAMDPLKDTPIKNGDQKFIFNIYYNFIPKFSPTMVAVIPDKKLVCCVFNIGTDM